MQKWRQIRRFGDHICMITGPSGAVRTGLTQCRWSTSPAVTTSSAARSRASCGSRAFSPWRLRIAADEMLTYDWELADAVAAAGMSVAQPR